MKKLLTLIVLLAAAVGSYADTETLLTYTITAADTANSQTAVAAGAGTFYIGAAKGKVEATEITSSGYAYKLDGNNSSTNTKYALLTLADGVTFEAGDIISVQFFATSTPSDARPYGIGIYTSLGGDVIANDTCSAKNTLDTWDYVVTSGDGIEGVSAIYLQRNDGYSVYFYSVTITRESTSSDDSDDDDDTTTGTTLTADIELTSNTPESEGTVTELSEVVIDVDADDWALNVDSAMAYVTLYSKTGGIYTVDTIVKNDEGQLVISTETITDEVTLTLSIPEGILGDSEWNTSGGVYGHTNATAVFYYIVAADEEETSYEWVTEPAEGTVESLDTILVYIGDKTTALSVTWNVNPTISDADGNTTEINVNKQVNAQYDTDWSTYSYSWLEVILPEAVTTAGTYTLTFPSGSLTVEDATYETEVTFTWEVTGTTTEDEETDTIEIPDLPTTTSLTISPTNGSTVNELSSFTVTFNDYSTVSYTKTTYVYTDAACTTYATTSSGGTVYANPSTNGNVVTISLGSRAISTAGTYYTKITCANLVVDGSSGSDIGDIIVTYVVDPDAVIESDDDDDDEEEEEVTYSIESITITEGAELDSIKSGETLQFSIEPYSKIGYAFTKIGTTAGGADTKSRSSLTYNSETTYWEQEVYNDIALTTGTYYLTVVAYATENDFNYGNDPLVSDTISFTGKAEEYSYSEYTLVSVDPENESEVSSKEDLNVTLTFSGAVNINSSTSFVNYGQGITYPFDAITSSDGADYSTTWTLTVSSSTLSILGDGATLTVVAADETGALVYDETLSEGSDSYTYLNLYYEFSDAGLTDFTISPEEGTVDSLYSFVLSYDGATAIAPTWTAYPTLYNADGDTVEYINDNVVADYDALTVTFTLSEAVTTAGTYTLSIPKQTVLINDDTSSYNAALSYTYTIEEATEEEDTTAAVIVSDSLLIDTLAEYTGGQILTGEYCTVTLGDDTWTNKGANDGAGDPFYAYIIGTNNPLDDSSTKWSSSGNLPTKGAYYIVSPTVDGTVTTGVVINATKYVLIVKESDNTYLTLDEITCSEELTETDGIPTVGSAKLYGTLTFEATAGENYYIFTEGSKLGTYGVVFTAEITEEDDETGDDSGDDSGDTGEEDTDGISNVTISAENGLYNVYTLNGQRVTTFSDPTKLGDLPKGIYIVNRKKYVVK